MSSQVHYPAVWRCLPPVSGYYVTAYYGRANWFGEFQGVGLCILDDEQVSNFKPKDGMFYFGPIQFAETQENMLALVNKES